MEYMLKILQKFFDFCGKDKGKFYRSLVDGVVLAFMEALKIPAIMLMMQGAIHHRRELKQAILVKLLNEIHHFDFFDTVFFLPDSGNIFHL